MFTNPLADASGARAGRIWVGCVTTGGARDFMKSTLTCTGVITLADGTLALHGNASPNARTTTVAVTGGTGAYANARGVYVKRTGVRRLVDDDHARRLIALTGRGAAAPRRRSAPTAPR